MQKMFQLTNTSLIPMNYSLELLNESGDHLKDFSVTPSQGSIPEQASIPLLLKFKPSRIESYAGFVVVHVEGVGCDLLRLPIIAKSVVPKASLII